MKRLVEAYSPTDAPVKMLKLVCRYQPQKEGLHAQVEFTVDARPIPREGNEDMPTSGPAGLEAIEFTFVLYDIFDNFMTSVQGVAGPGKYVSGRKRHRAKWLFELDGAFSQYHALCFPLQARGLDAAVWRCNREECLEWLNSRFGDAGVSVTGEDVFPDGAAREGTSE